MPPHDCEGYIGPLFFKVGNGEYVPFPGIQEMTLPKVDDPKYADAVSVQSAVDTSMTIEMKMTYRSARMLYKTLRADINRAKRRRRRFMRWKEKIRRNTLKYGR
jgi:hypothetical protein